MKRRNEKQNTKLVVLASAVGAAAVAVSVAAAYSGISKSLIKTTSGVSSYEYTYTNSSVPVQNNVSNVPMSSSKSSSSSTAKSSSTEPPVEQTNKPVVAEIGNIMPVNGEVSHPFSNGELVKSETLGVWKTHDGCDILCDMGTDVKSMSEGIVKMIDNSTIWGVCVTIEQNNGLEVQYCGLDKDLNVKTGAIVKQGEIIGKTGDTNEAEMLQKPHLHIGVKKNGNWVDPVSVVE